MPELIDVLDENGDKTGKVATRQEVHEQGLWHRIAIVVILDQDDRILLQKRSNAKQTNPGKWDIAVAGHVDAGEDALATAERETLEEIGIVAKNLEYLLSYRKQKNYEWQGKKFMDNQIFDCFVLRIPEIDPKNLRLQEDEVQAVKLCTPAEFLNMINAGKIVNRKILYQEIIRLVEDDK